jgi:hypothetical protein
MKRIFRMAVTLVQILGLAACASRLPTQPASHPTDLAPERSYPLTTRTGIADIDRILEASGDTDQLRSLVEFTTAGCTTRDGLGGPPKCLPGEGEGTPVEVLPFLGPEGSFLRREQIKDWPGFEPLGILSIYEVSQAAEADENYPAGTYAILFAGTEDQPATSLRVSNGHIVRVDTVFDPSLEALEQMLQREAASVILAPLKQ